MNKLNFGKFSPIFLITLVLFLIAVIGCGGGTSDGDSGSALVKVADFERILTIDDVKNVGWKRGKTYDVEGLDGAEEAYLGFWTPPGLGSLN